MTSEGLAALVDEVSNRLQVVLGFAQILHELEPPERAHAIETIERECASLRETLGSLTRAARESGGFGPSTGSWQRMDPVD